MSRVLRSEQVKAISTLTSGEDLLAVLPTGFGKSLIFQLLVRVVECLTGKASCVLVVCPLKSIIQDQLAEATSLGLKAVALGNCRLDDISSGKYQIIYGSAEEILSKPFLPSFLPFLFFLPAPSPLTLTRPISSSLREFQHGAFAIKTIRARPMKTPALQAMTVSINFINGKVWIFTPL